jgi:hypothetical protein
VGERNKLHKRVIRKAGTWEGRDEDFGHLHRFRLQVAKTERETGLNLGILKNKYFGRLVSVLIYILASSLK